MSSSRCLDRVGPGHPRPEILPRAFAWMARSTHPDRAVDRPREGFRISSVACPSRCADGMHGDRRRRRGRPARPLAAFVRSAAAALLLPLIALTAATAHAQSTPEIVAMLVAPAPGEGQHQRYKIGDAVRVVVTFQEIVVVTGTPQLVINVGGAPKTLSYSSGSGTAFLTFTGYTVAEGDEDTDGISIDADSMTLNAGAIKASDNAEDADLTHAAVAANAGQMVDGVRPTVSVGTAATSDDPAGIVIRSFEELRPTDPLDPLSAPPGSAFSVTVSSGTAPTVDSVFVFDFGILLSLSDAVDAAAHVRVSYTPPTGMDGTPIRDLAGNAMESFTGLTVGNSALAPDTPTGVSLIPGPGTLTVSWNTVRQADGYEVQWSLEGDEENTDTFEDQRAFVSGGNATSYTIRNLTPGMSYTVEVLARRTYSTASSSSDEVTGTPLDAKVSSIALTSDPGADETYTAGDVIKATVTFNGKVDVTGTPRLRLSFGFRDQDADCTAGMGVTRIVCSHTVVAGDDTFVDSIQLSANSLAKNGATLRLAGTEHDADLGTSSQTFAGHNVDTESPTLQPFQSSLAVFDTAGILRMFFSENLSTTTARPDAFTVWVDSVRREVTSIGVGGPYIYLTLASAVAHGETVTLDYTDPSADNDVRAVQDRAGNDAASFTGQAVVNYVPATAVVVPDAPAKPVLTVKGARTIEVDWDEPADNGQSITSYRIEISPDGIAWRDLVGNTLSTDTFYRDETVPPASKRYYRISAILAGSTGPASPPASAKTPGGGWWVSDAPASVAEGEEIVFNLKFAQSFSAVRVRVSDTGGVIDAITGEDRLSRQSSYTYYTASGWKVTERTPDTYRLVDQEAWPFGSGEATVRVRTRANGMVGEGGSVTLTIHARTPGKAKEPDRIEPYTATVQVTDNEPAGLYVEDAEANEADGTLDFRVRLNKGPYQDSATVDYKTVDVTAKAGSDYTAVDSTAENGTPLTFTANQTEKTVSVPLIADGVADDNQTLRLVLSNPSPGVKIRRGEALGTIRDSSAGTGAITGIMLVDGATGTDFGMIHLGTIGSPGTLTLPDPLGHYRLKAVTSPSASLGSVKFSLVGPKDMTATENEAPYELFGNSSQTLPSGNYGLAVVAYSKDNAEGEVLQSLDGWFDITAADPVPAGDALSGLTLTSKTGGSPQAIDGFPVFTREVGERFEIAAVVEDESVIGSVRLELLGASTAARTDNKAPYELFGGSGKAIPSGVYTVRAIVYGNANGGGSVLQELERMFTLGELTAAFEGVPDEHVEKGFTFHVRFNEPATVSDAALKRALEVTGGTVTSVKHVDGRADLREVRVQPTDDVTDVGLSLPATTDCRAARAVCTHDQRALSNASSDTVTAAVTMSVSNAVGLEGHTADFKVRLNKASDKAVTVDYETRDGTAKAGSDYTAVDSTTLTITPGVTVTTVSVTLTDDGDDPENTAHVIDDGETFWLVLSNASGARLEDGNPVREALGEDDPGSGRGTIRETGNIESPTLKVYDDGALEGRDGVLLFPVTLSPPYIFDLTVDYATADGTAVAGEDYEETSGTLTFKPGDVLKYVRVPIIDDVDEDSGETLTVTLSNPHVVAVIDNDHGTATGTIWNTEAVMLSVADAEGTEGDGVLQFEVTLNQAAESEVTVDYATSDGTATEGEDYEAARGTLTFAAGELSKTVSVPLTADDAEEGEETLTLALTNPSGAGAADAIAIGTIRDGEATQAETGPVPASLSVGDAAAEAGRFQVKASFAEAVSGIALSDLSAIRADGTAVAVSDLAEAGTGRAWTAWVAAAEAGRYVVVLEAGAGNAGSRKSASAVLVVDVDAQGNATAVESQFTKLTLVDARRAEDVGAIADGAAFTLAAPATGKYGVVAEAAPDAGIGSVFFTLSGPAARTAVDNAAPWSLYGDQGGRALGGGLPAGSYTLTVTAWSETQAKGEILYVARASFTVEAAPDAAPGLMTGFTLVDASANTDLGAIADGAALTLADPQGGSYGVRVETAEDAEIGSIVLALAGAKTVNKTESYAPYSLYGDTDLIVAGENLPVGNYTLTATAYDQAGGAGEVLQTLSVSFTVAAETTEDTSAGDALTATFQDVPKTHDGPGEGNFIFRVLFSEDVATGYEVLRDESFAVTGGTVRKARRVLDENGEGRDDLREIHVEPGTWDAVTVTLAGGRACGTEGAVCTADNLVLSNTETRTIPGPLALSVADARVEEAGNATLDFVVTLSRASTETVTVDYATADGTATQPADYVAASGKLSFAPGVTERTVSVTVKDDAHNEEEETMTLALSNASGARIRDGEAVGTIANSDPIPDAWLARFGRTVADHVVDAIGTRLAGSPGGPSHVTLGGQRIALDGGPSGSATEARADAGDDEAADMLTAFAGRIGGSGGGSARTGGQDGAAAEQEMTDRELLLGSSFVLNLSGDGKEVAFGGTRWTAWGRAASSRFDGEEEGLALDGDVTTFTLGADAAWERWLAGVAVSLSEGAGSFRDHADGDHESRGSGELESTLTSVHPYARLEVSERLSLWGVLGVGTGTLGMRLDGEDGERWTTDTAQEMAAAGMRSVLVEAPADGGLELGLRGDAVMQRMRSDAATGSNGGNLGAADVQTSRLRLALEGRHAVALEGGGRIVPSSSRSGCARTAAMPRPGPAWRSAAVSPGPTRRADSRWRRRRAPSWRTRIATTASGARRARCASSRMPRAGASRSASRPPGARPRAGRSGSGSTAMHAAWRRTRGPGPEAVSRRSWATGSRCSTIGGLRRPGWGSRARRRARRSSSASA